MSARFYMMECGRTFDVSKLQDAVDFVCMYPDFVERWITQLNKIGVKRKPKARGESIY